MTAAIVFIMLNFKGRSVLEIQNLLEETGHYLAFYNLFYMCALYIVTINCVHQTYNFGKCGFLVALWAYIPLCIRCSQRRKFYSALTNIS